MIMKPKADTIFHLNLSKSCYTSEVCAVINGVEVSYSKRQNTAFSDTLVFVLPLYFQNLYHIVFSPHIIMRSLSLKTFNSTYTMLPVS